MANSVKPNRTKARVYVLQYLYSLEMNPEGIDNLNSVIASDTSTDEEPKVSSDVDMAYAESIIEHIKEHGKEIDDLISGHLRKWSLNQLNVVDKNILRMALAEFLYTDPEQRLKPAIIINEAVKMAREYGGENSYKFINGLLDTVFKEHHG
jgi:N utilization substance protein B